MTLRIEELWAKKGELVSPDGTWNRAALQRVSPEEVAAALPDEVLEAEAKRRGIWPVLPWEYVGPPGVQVPRVDDETSLGWMRNTEDS